MDGFVWAYNGTGKIALGFGRFRHTAEGKEALENDLPFENFKDGKLYGYGTSHWGTYFNFHTGGDIKRGVEWVCEAYLRLKVSQRVTDDWFAGDTNTFDHEDNR